MDGGMGRLRDIEEGKMRSENGWKDSWVGL